MKILMVIDAIDKGGKERRMLELIKGLTRNGSGYNIFLIAFSEKVEYASVYDLPIRFEILKRRYKKDVMAPFKLRKIISEFKPDIIQSWSTMSSVYLALANMFTGIPLINAVLADAPAHVGLSNTHYLRIKLTTPFTKLFVSNSLAGIRAYKTPARKSVVIYNGMDFNRFRNLCPAGVLKRELLKNNNEDKFIVGMVSSFDERKDFETLVKVAVKMCQMNPSWVFILIGSGPLLEPLKASVPDQLLHNHQIIFTGKRKDVESVLQIMDLGVLMTNAENHGEGISNSIIECMASGMPVLASRGGGTDEVIKDGYNGFLIDPKSEAQLSEKIEFLFNNQVLLKQMSGNAFNYAREHFELENKTCEYKMLYNDLITKPGLPINDR